MIYCDLQGLHRSKVMVQMKGYVIMSSHLSIIVPIPLTGALLKIRFMMSQDLKVRFCDVTWTELQRFAPKLSPKYVQ